MILRRGWTVNEKFPISYIFRQKQENIHAYRGKGRCFTLFLSNSLDFAPLQLLSVDVIEKLKHPIASQSTGDAVHVELKEMLKEQE